jgi:serine beta-lactamase-like protein LACTB, mitochondrial
MSGRRLHTWLAVFVVAIGLLVTAVLAMFLYMFVTGPLHSDPDSLPSIARDKPSNEWLDAAGRGRQIMHDALVEQNLPGLSVAVGVGGDIVWAEGFGWADLEKRVAVAPETRFPIGSASIALTSAAVGLLLEQNKLALDRKVQTYAPEVPEKDWPVTVGQLMAHTAGVADDGGEQGPLFGKHCERPVDGLRILAGFERQLRFTPGTQFLRTNYGWIIVSAAVEGAAGEPFTVFMQKQIFEPLGMGATIVASTGEPMADRATSYFPRFMAAPRYGAQPWDPQDLSCFAGGGAFLSTPSDLVRFGMAVNSGRLLQPATVKLLQTPQRLPSGQETGYGLGWDVRNVTLAGAHTRWIGHEGTLSMGGNMASLITFPERGIAVAVTTNISYADTVSLAVRVAEAFAVSRRQ